MSITDLVYVGPQLFTFNRMLIVVVIGLMTIFFDGGLMKKMGLQRESFWSKIFGGILILGGIGAWIAFMFLG